MYGFLLVANCGHAYFDKAWHEFFVPECKQKQSFAIISELLEGSAIVNLRTELYFLQTTFDWPSLKLNAFVRIPASLMTIFSHDSERAHAVYSVLLTKAYVKDRIEPLRLIRYAHNKWDRSIYKQLIENGVQV